MVPSTILRETTCKKKHTKGGRFITKWRVCEVVQFPGCFLLGGHLSKWIFAQGRSTRSPWCLETIQGPIWRSKDHLVMKVLSKNVKIMNFKETLFGETENWRRGVYFDAEYLSGQFCRVKTAWMAIWNKKNKQIQKIKFFSFWTCRSPVGQPATAINTCSLSSCLAYWLACACKAQP